MKLYAFSDFHLSGDPPTKPMDIFGDHWKNHRQKIVNSWLETIKPEDTVILAGDLSWAMNLKTAISDLLMIGNLPGRKIIVRGNHDYWWDTVNKSRTNSSHRYQRLDSGNFTKIYKRWWKNFGTWRRTHGARFNFRTKTSLRAYYCMPSLSALWWST